jgi:hypothetical protein
VMCFSENTLFFQTAKQNGHGVFYTMIMNL